MNRQTFPQLNKAARSLRHRLRMTRIEIAAAVGLRPDHVAEIETGSAPVGVLEANSYIGAFGIDLYVAAAVWFLDTNRLPSYRVKEAADRLNEASRARIDKQIEIHRKPVEE